jgi:hypothetical protein
MPFEGVVPVVVVAFTDMLMSGGLGGRAGGNVGGAVGPNKINAVSRESMGSGTAGEFGLCILSMLWAVWADAVLDPDDKDNLLGLYQKLEHEGVREGGV